MLDTLMRPLCLSTALGLAWAATPAAIVVGPGDGWPITIARIQTASAQERSGLADAVGSAVGAVGDAVGAVGDAVGSGRGSSRGKSDTKGKGSGSENGASGRGGGSGDDGGGEKGTAAGESPDKGGPGGEASGRGGGHGDDGGAGQGGAGKGKGGAATGAIGNGRTGGGAATTDPTDGDSASEPGDGSNDGRDDGNITVDLGNDQTVRIDGSDDRDDSLLKPLGLQQRGHDLRPDEEARLIARGWQ